MKDKVEAALRKLEGAVRDLESVQESLEVESPEIKSSIYQLTRERERLEGLLQLVEALA